MGGGAVHFNTVEVASPSFDEVLDDPRRGSSLTQATALLQVALGADYLVALGESPRGIRGVTLGLRVGYTFSPWSADWIQEGFKVPGGPDLGLNGFHARVLVGGAGRVRHP